MSSNGLNIYLYHLRNFCLLFGIRRKKPEIRNINQIIIELQEVYEFDKVFVNNVGRYYGLNDEASTGTEGPHETVSTVIVKDEERILYGLRHLRKAVEDLCPRF